MTKPYYCSFHKKFSKFNAGKSSVTTLLTFTWPNPKRREKYAIKQHRTTIVKPNPITFLQPCIGGKTLHNVQLCAPQKKTPAVLVKLHRVFAFASHAPPVLFGFLFVLRQSPLSGEVFGRFWTCNE